MRQATEITVRALVSGEVAAAKSGGEGESLTEAE